MKGFLKAALLFVCMTPLGAQTILTGDHLVEGRLQLGNSLTPSSLEIFGETGALAAPALISSGDGGFVFTGTEGVGSIPEEGAGTRFMWYSGKAALRVGTIDSTWWDDVSVGFNSVAFSYSRAAGALSFAVNAGEAEGMGAFAANEGRASGDRTIAIGEGVEALAYKSFAIGTFNAVESGEDDTNWVSTDPLFIVGNGTGNPLDPPDIQNRNAFIIRKNGDVTMTGRVEMPVQGDILMGEFGN